MFRHSQDTEFLITTQYNNAVNYQARVNITKYGTSPLSRQKWLAKKIQYTLRPSSHMQIFNILELGSGDGKMWQHFDVDFALRGNITLSDASNGMLNDCQKNLNTSPLPLSYQVIDANQSAELETNYDCIIANNLLYHLADPEKFLRDIKDKLLPQGYIFVSSLDSGVNQSIWDIAHEINSNVPSQSFTAACTSEKIKTMLSELFPAEAIQEKHYKNTLKFTDADAVISMIASTPEVQAKHEYLEQQNFFTLFQQKITTIIEKEQSINSKFNATLFCCRKF